MIEASQSRDYLLTVSLTHARSNGFSWPVGLLVGASRDISIWNLGDLLFVNSVDGREGEGSSLVALMRRASLGAGRVIPPPSARRCCLCFLFRVIAALL